MTLLLLIILVWVIVALYFADLSAKLLTPQDFSKVDRVLVVFPHPDDEAFNVAGLIRYLANLKKEVILCILTKGECGTSDASLDFDLKDIRYSELVKSARILGVSQIISEDFGDGSLENKKPELKNYLFGLITKLRPDVVVTYDQAGMYGHEDHIALSQVLYEVVANVSSTALWYVSYPINQLKSMNLPFHMAKSDEYKKHYSVPTLRLYVLPLLLVKLRSIFAHKSQLADLKKLVSFGDLVFGLFMTLCWFEYFYVAIPIRSQKY